MLPRFTVAAADTMTRYGPLLALGCYVRDQDLLAPLRSRLRFEGPTHCGAPTEALIDLLVGLLAGCAGVAQVNTTIRPDRLLAQAWGRRVFAEQSTIARTLDACGPQQVEQATAAHAALWQRMSCVGAHLQAGETLLVDVDLTGLPASPHAEASTTGYFSGKKTPPAGSWPAWVRRPSAKSCTRTCGPATPPAVWRCNRPLWPWSNSCRSHPANGRPFWCVSMAALARMAT